MEDHCKKHILCIQDAMEVLKGRWKIQILSVLCYNNKRRFSDLLGDVRGISNKMLSKELKDLEEHKLLIRNVESTQPILVTYELTQHGKKLQEVMSKLSEWGSEHRNQMIPLTQ
jgi:DNA-binding HxlR family transcriptional regulator